MGRNVSVKLLGLHGRYQNARVCAERFSGLRLSKQQTFKEESSGPEAFLPGTRELWRKVQVEGGCGDSMGGTIEAGESCLEMGKASIQLEASNGNQLSVEILTLEAPFIVEAEVKLHKNIQRKQRDPSKLGPGCQTRAWWYSNNEEPFFGIQDSVALVKATFDKHAENGVPFDGLIGFSQGASLASLLCSDEHLPSLHSLQYAFLCSGYVFSDLLSFQSASHVKSLHVFSDMDRMIRMEKSEELATQMRGVSAKHDGGHHVPIPWFHDVLFDFFFCNE